MNNIESALELIKQGLAAVQCDWPSRVKLVEAVRVIEQSLVDLRTENEKFKGSRKMGESID